MALRVAAVEEHWAADARRCTDKEDSTAVVEELTAHDLRPTGQVVRLSGTALMHHLRSLNIAHYFHESFVPFYTLLDGLLGSQAHARRPQLGWLQQWRTRFGAAPPAVLLDSIVDHRRWSANAQ
jgi:hypothetical protein